MHRTLKVFVSVIVALVVIGLVVGVYSYHRQSAEQQYEKLMSEGMSLEKAQQYGQAIDDFTQATSLASTPAEVSTARLDLAEALLSRQEGQDVPTAIGLLTTVAVDSKAPAKSRAQAYAHLSYFYSIGGSGNNNADFRNYVLTQPALTSYLTQASGDVVKASMLLLQKSNELQPSAIVSFRIASLDAVTLNELGTYDIKDPAQLQTAKNIYTAIQTGDTLLASQGSSTPVTQLASMYVSRSLALGVASYYLPQVTNAMVDDSYDKTLSYLDQASSSDALKEESVIARLTYAASLEAREPGKQDTKVKTLLDEFIAGSKSYPHVNGIVLRIRSYAPGTPILVVMPKLAKLSPSFKTYLSQLGWTI